MTNEQLAGLIEKVEGAVGADREIDGAIALWEGWTFTKTVRDKTAYWRRPGVTEWYQRVQEGPPRYTASIDAALALVERMLPGARVGLDPIFFGCDEPTRVEWDAILCTPHWHRWNPVNSEWIERAEARHKDRIRAILLALLRSLQARE